MTEVSDSLIIYVSNDCGETWTRVFEGGEDGTGNFATHELTDYDFWPQTGSDWCMWGWGASCFNIDLSPWAGENNIQIAFETYSFYGNPILIDNVIISQYVGEDELKSENEVRVYPNPSNGQFTIDLPTDHSYFELQITDQAGSIVLIEPIEYNMSTLNINDSNHLPSGIYVINIIGKGESFTQKVVIY